ncbi:hypothetical protein H312_02189 [Anncaliia algerae PRA339]|uniref:Cytochrome b5 heme-binding domain-containing protein n=1 Tax=Anncaliia algerae PRA339 TaxID=1288291 RepID=A0A059F0A6_9MICR|nr:hypothetical protein H312_02189 [Anncaliia algerae PRA339]
MLLFSWFKRIPKERKIIKMDKKEVEKHNVLDDCWVIIENNVYDVTEFIEYHPCGRNIFLNYGGKDVTEIFNRVHPYVSYKELLKYEQVGYLENE